MERARERWSTNAWVFGLDPGQDHRDAVARRLFIRPLCRQVRPAHQGRRALLQEKMRRIRTGAEIVLKADRAALYRVWSVE